MYGTAFSPWDIHFLFIFFHVLHVRSVINTPTRSWWILQAIHCFLLTLLIRTFSGVFTQVLAGETPEKVRSLSLIRVVTYSSFRECPEILQSSVHIWKQLQSCFGQSASQQSREHEEVFIFSTIDCFGSCSDWLEFVLERYVNYSFSTFISLQIHRFLVFTFLDNPGISSRGPCYLTDH